MKNLSKWGSLVIYLILAGISCWATEHSFHLLISFMPEIFIWGLTIAFFIVASIGTKMMVDGLNKDIYLENRRRTFWMGTALACFFWLLMSMPTNTHTFFYNHKIGNTLQDDIAATSAYLKQIGNKENIDSSYYAFHDEVMELRNNLTNEFNGNGPSGKMGNGKFVQDWLDKINAKFQAEGVRPIPTELPFNSSDSKILIKYQNGIASALERVQYKEKYRVSTREAQQASELLEELNILDEAISDLVATDEIQHREDVVTQAEGVLSNAYACVKSNARFVKFTSDADKELYTQDNLETRTKRMLSVIDVWIDFIGGKYPLSFLFYVLVSILVDIAAFIFFDLTFMKREY